MTRRTTIAAMLFAVGCAGASSAQGTLAAGAMETESNQNAPAPPESQEEPARANPQDRHIEGELADSDPRVADDDSPYDEYEVRVPANWEIEVTMASADFDTYLWLIGPDGGSILQDDDGGEGTNSSFRHTVRQAGLYTIRANSYDSDGRGRYELWIRTTGPTAAP